MTGEEAPGKLERSGQFIFFTIPAIGVGSLGLLAITVNLANVVGRYAFAAPIVWAEELMRYSLIWIVFLGAIMVTWKAEHLAIDLLARPKNRILRAAFRVVFDLGLLLTFAIVIYTAFKVVGFIYDLNKTSVIMGLPMEVAHFAVLFGFCMQALAVVWRWGVAGQRRRRPAPTNGT